MMTPQDIEDFIDGYIEAALWADCLPPEPTEAEIREYANDCYSGKLTESIIESARERLMDNAELGGKEELEMRPEGREHMAKDCREFCQDNEADLDAYAEEINYNPNEGTPYTYAGHDFWLTRTGHGAGFWDRGLGDLGERLSKAAHTYGVSIFAPFDCGDGTANV